PPRSRHQRSQTSVRQGQARQSAAVGEAGGSGQRSRSSPHSVCGRRSGLPAWRTGSPGGPVGREPRKAYMSTGLIIALIVIAAVLVAVAAVVALRARGPRHGMSLKRRFGPEYERAVARHDGDTQAAERELADRVERHG